MSAGTGGDGYKISYSCKTLVCRWSPRLICWATAAPKQHQQNVDFNLLPDDRWALTSTPQSHWRPPVAAAGRLLLHCSASCHYCDPARSRWQVGCLPRCQCCRAESRCAGSASWTVVTRCSDRLLVTDRETWFCPALQLNTHTHTRHTIISYSTVDVWKQITFFGICLTILFPKISPG